MSSQIISYIQVFFVGRGGGVGSGTEKILGSPAPSNTGHSDVTKHDLYFLAWPMNCRKTGRNYMKYERAHDRKVV